MASTTSKLKSALRAWRGRLPAKLLVGVSGGADSVALLHALVELDYRPHVCHLNHRWRGKASDADAAFVRALAVKLGLPVTMGRLSRSNNVGAVFNRDSLCSRSGLETPPTGGKESEDAARRARLAFFERVARKTGIRTLVLAHTADDQVETVLMRLIRGAGPTGLAGMAAERTLGKLRVVRPLLAVGRKDVLAYLSAHKLDYREDASNRDVRFLRNRVRQVLLPLLEQEFNPGIRRVLLRTAAIMRGEAAKQPVTRQFDVREVEAVRKRQGGVKPPHSKTEWFDADVLGPRPFVRTWRAGDRFQPLGMNGEKKLQDFFVDEKVPRADRARVPVLCATDGRIAWVVGYRLAEPFKVTTATKRVTQVRWTPGGVRR